MREEKFWDGLRIDFSPIEWEKKVELWCSGERSLDPLLSASLFFIPFSSINAAMTVIF
jgi:hypothetical protein